MTPPGRLGGRGGGAVATVPSILSIATAAAAAAPAVGEVRALGATLGGNSGNVRKTLNDKNHQPLSQKFRQLTKNRTEKMLINENI